MENQDTNIIAEWAAGRLSKEEMQKIEKEYALEDLAMVLQDMEQWSLPSYDSENELAKLIEKKNKSTRGKKIKLRTITSIAASFIILLGTSLFFMLSSNTIELSTQVGEVLNQELPSGSIMILDANSTASYPKKKKGNQELISLAGQAYFEVVKGTPFVVETQHGKIEVLGTRFNVLSDSVSLSVNCYEGIVKVSSGGMLKVLKEQKGIIIKKDELFEVEVSRDMPDWTKGFTKYQAILLSKVVDDFQKYYEININLPSNYKNLEYSGIMVHNDLETALELVFKPMGITYTLTEDNKVIFD